jgi:hypothetical protein
MSEFPLFELSAGNAERAPARIASDDAMRRLFIKDSTGEEAKLLKGPLSTYAHEAIARAHAAGR